MNQKTLENYIRYCLFLAKCGIGNVSPNPPVGAILVYNDKIIAESYHKIFGGPHAEVNAIENVPDNQAHLIKDASLFVSLEPCMHHGKTPACTTLILKHQIKKLVFGCYDPNPLMAGKSIRYLQDQGVEVTGPVLEQESLEMIQEFRVNISQKRPYIILKLAQSSDYFMGKKGEKIKISSDYSDILTHRWRSETDAILVGSATVRTDNPQLTNRHWLGKNPIRIVLGTMSPLESKSYHIFNGDAETLVFGQKPAADNYFLENLLRNLYERNIGILTVEGGARTISSFYEKHLWDEARIITNTALRLHNGILSPGITGRLKKTITLEKDIIHYISKNQA